MTWDSDFSGFGPRSFPAASSSARMSERKFILGKVMMIPSRFVSLSTSTRNPTAQDSWIRRRDPVSRAK
jgi:hypothetical protein